jgi:hypothetical protein
LRLEALLAAVVAQLAATEQALMLEPKTVAGLQRLRKTLTVAQVWALDRGSK